MGKALEKLTKGLLEGFGTGMQQVGGSMIEREKAAAAELRAQNLARFQQGLKDKSQEKQNKFVVQEGLLSDNRRQENAKELAKINNESADNRAAAKANEYKTDSGIVINPDTGQPEKYVTNPNGDRKLIGTPTVEELKKLAGKAGKSIKIKASMYKIGAQNVFDGVFREYSDSLKGENKDLNMAQFMITNADGTSGGLNIPVIKSQLPKEMADELIAKTQLMETAMEAGYNPAKASAYANDQYNGLKKKSSTDAQNKKFTEISKTSGLPVSAVEQLITDSKNPDFTQNFVKNYTAEDPDDVKVLKALKNFNPTLHDNLVMLIHNKTSSALTEVQPSLTKTSTPTKNRFSENVAKEGLIPLAASSISNHISKSIKNSPGLF